MIERAGTTFQSLQGLQAARSFNAERKSGSVFRQALEGELNEPEESKLLSLPEKDSETDNVVTSYEYSSSLEEIKPKPRIEVKSVMPLQTIIQEVSQIARQNGYIGLNSQDIVRAYQSGQSFLADYRV